MSASVSRKILRELWIEYLSRRQKGYVRIATTLITVGALSVSTSLGVLVFQAITEAAHIVSNDAPWWVAVLFGSLLVVLGVFIFVYFDRRERGVVEARPVHIVVAPNTSFEEMAEAVGVVFDRAVILEGFDANERNTILQKKELSDLNIKGMLLQLRGVADSGAIPDYEVIEQDGPVIVRRK